MTYLLKSEKNMPNRFPFPDRLRLVCIHAASDSRPKLLAWNEIVGRVCRCGVLTPALPVAVITRFIVQHLYAVLCSVYLDILANINECYYWNFSCDISSGTALWWKILYEPENSTRC